MESIFSTGHISLLFPEKPPSQLCLNEKFIAFPNGDANSRGNLIEVCTFEESSLPNTPPKLTLDGGFEKNITCMALGKACHGSTICIAAKDRIGVWMSLEEEIHALTHSEANGSSVENFVVLAENLGNVQHAAFDQETDRLVAVCIEKSTVIWELETFKAIVTLEGHSSRVTASSFFPKKSHMMVTISGIH
jgi:WD40 repeat protein